MKGGKKRPSVDPPPPTAEDGGGGGAKCGGDDQTPLYPPPPLDGPAEEDLQKQQKKNLDKGAEEEAAAEEGGEEEEEEEEEEGGEGNDHFKDLQIEEDAEVEGDEDDERPKLAEGFYEIEAVRRKRVRKGQVQYLIKWRGWPETANTWEPFENLLSCSDVIDSFEESLRSGKRSARRRKRKYGSTQSQTKKKQQQRSPAAGTYDVPAVKVRILDKPLPLPPLNDPGITNEEASVGGVNNVETAKKMNENGMKSVTYRTEEMEEQNELNLKISELKGTTTTSENCVDKFTVHSEEAQLSEQGGLSNGFQKADGAEPAQSGRCTGSRRRKSGSVKRFKQEMPPGTTGHSQNIAGVNGSCGTGNEVSQNFDLMANDFGCKSKSEKSKNIIDITEIIKPVSYSSAEATNGQGISVTFMAKRADGTEVMVNNKFLKANHPVLLINFYEQHLRSGCFYEELVDERVGILAASKLLQALMTMLHVAF